MFFVVVVICTVTFDEWTSFEHSADFLRTYFFFVFRFVPSLVLSPSSPNHGHLIKVTSAWLTCKFMDAIFSKLQLHCEQLSRTWNSESGLKGAFSCSLLLLGTGESILPFLSRAKARKSFCRIEACGNPGRRFVVVLIFEE